MFSLQHEFMLVQLQREALETKSKHAWKFFVTSERVPSQKDDDTVCCDCSCEA